MTTHISPQHPAQQDGVGPDGSTVDSHAPPGPPAGPARRSAYRLGRPGVQDLTASLVVFLIAVPISLGIALAVGAPLTAGLVAAAAGGIVAGLLGGAPLQVTGPSAALTVVVAGLVPRYGWQATCAITVAAGLLQLLLGTLRVARSALALSPAVVHGMLAGVGLTIALAQLHVVLGGSPQGSATANLAALPGQLAAPQPGALAVGLLALTLLCCWPRLHQLPGRAGRVGARLGRVPAALVAVAAGTALAVIGDLRLARVDLPRWSEHSLAVLPHGPVAGLLAAVLTVAAVASVESLLCAVAVGRLTGTTGDLDRELRGQGLANLASGLLGGLPVAGGVVRSSANIQVGARSRWSTALHGVWLLLAAVALTGGMRRIPLAALAALVLVVGIQMVSLAHIRKVHRHREFTVYAATVLGVVVLGVPIGVAAGALTAAVLACYRLTHARVEVAALADGSYEVRTHGPLTFFAVPRLSRALASVPSHATVTVRHDGAFIDHASYEALHAWRDDHLAHGGQAVLLTDPAGHEAIDPDGTLRGDNSTSRHGFQPWTPWVGRHSIDRAADDPHGRLLEGVRGFQTHTADLVRPELARLAREGQTPSELFLTCSDSRLVTSMITSSGPGDLFTVRNVGNLVPAPHEPGAADDSVAAAVQYAVEVLEVRSITICGHSGCGAMNALLNGVHEQPGRPTSLARWLRNGRGSLARLARVPAEFADRPVVDQVEQLCITNVVQQLDQLLANPTVERRVAAGELRLVGMYFDFATAQTYVLDRETGRFDAVVVGATPEVASAA
ncbi:SulP family inorganic anion transporter [Kitasatospora viridis]|uniref:Carbonic anhydrase n=1 Tax=Kitasatospora viridis TaxID=281105 RepID=A0A561UIH4_9ACTN|nr:SulP family inorganic anion transporter [Kitasatospora viridis]TWF99144.1 carbonic anhydrase [Kitasatospora viridis]